MCWGWMPKPTYTRSTGGLLGSVMSVVVKKIIYLYHHTTLTSHPTSQQPDTELPLAVKRQVSSIICSLWQPYWMYFCRICVKITISQSKKRTQFLCGIINMYHDSFILTQAKDNWMTLHLSGAAYWEEFSYNYSALFSRERQYCLKLTGTW
jgi:hypothetical protein